MRDRSKARRASLGDAKEVRQRERGSLTEKQMIRDVIDDVSRRVSSSEQFKEVLTEEYPTLAFKGRGSEISYQHSNWGSHALGQGQDPR
jgi:hypothetical protein